MLSGVIVAIGLILLSWGLQPAASTTGEGMQNRPKDFHELSQQVRPGVVHIQVVKKVNIGGPFGGRHPFGDFFDPFSRDGRPRDFRQQGMGSGFIFDEEGHIITNHHVVENANQIKVKLADGNEVDAVVIGRDPKTDLALIKVDVADGLQPLKLGDSNDLRVGTWVVAVGSPYGLEQTVTAGIVSAKGRAIGAGPYDDFIQTDASINPGNSGGPLVNMKGEVVGINTAIMSQSGGNNGIGFAIPINMAKGVIGQLKEKGSVTRGWLGVVIQDLTPELSDYYQVGEREGVLVTQLSPGDPAERSGIAVGDVIVAVGDEDISSARELSRVIAQSPVDAPIKVRLIREGQEKTLEVELIGKGGADSPVKKAEGNRKGLGLELKEMTPELARQLGVPEDEQGILVMGVRPEGKGASAGMKRGDIIKELNREPVNSIDDLKDKISSADSGDHLRILVKRPRAGLVVFKVKV